jgi:hypothetical protein
MIEMKTRAFVGPIENGYTRLLLGEKEEERRYIKVDQLNPYLDEPIVEQDILEVTFSDDGEIIDAHKLPEEMEKARREVQALLDWLLDGKPIPKDLNDV